MMETTCSLMRRPDRRFDVLERIERDFQATPALSLTLAQARRLWALEHDTCAMLLQCLVEQRVLSRRADGRFVLASTNTLPPKLLAKAATGPVSLIA
ncbi:MAG: hypothetical protein KJ066_03920 [Acidobacteria bacterium]|nr:hypothetical protein [Acidobacteriota bacterium]